MIKKDHYTAEKKSFERMRFESGRTREAQSKKTILKFETAVRK